jgi:hypothetical protein
LFIPFLPICKWECILYVHLSISLNDFWNIYSWIIFIDSYIHLLKTNSVFYLLVCLV